MKQIIAGTNRPNSRTLAIARLVQKLYAEMGETVGLIDLALLDLSSAPGHYGDTAPPATKAAIEKINSADGLIVICPEYNGSYPGILKYFIDHWVYPDSFEYRPVCFIGLGARFGGLRPVEHLQGVFGYRNAFIFPERVFLTDIFKILKDGEITDPMLMTLLTAQAKGFILFTKGLELVGLDANSRLALKLAAKQSTANS